MTAETALIRPGRPSSEESAQLTDRVLDTAMRLFAERGYGTTSMAAIASAARVGKHTIYRRYPDKAALFRACVERTMLHIVETRSGADDGVGNPLERLRAIVGRAAMAALDDQMVALYRMAIAEALRFPEIAAIFCDPGSDPLIRRCADLIEEAQRAGDLGREDPIFLAEFALEATAGMVLQLSVAGRKLDRAGLDEFVDRSWRIFLSGAQPRS